MKIDFFFHLKRNCTVTCNSSQIKPVYKNNYTKIDSQENSRYNKTMNKVH